MEMEMNVRFRHGSRESGHQGGGTADGGADGACDVAGGALLAGQLGGIRSPRAAYCCLCL